MRTFSFFNENDWYSTHGHAIIFLLLFFRPWELNRFLQREVISQSQLFFLEEALGNYRLLFEIKEIVIVNL